MFSFGFYASTVYRFGKYIETLKGSPIFNPFYYIGNAFYYFLNLLIIKMFGIKIERAASIDSGFFINHFGGIHIKKCRIGKHCSIHAQVKIGGNDNPDIADSSGPVIGDNVWIGGHSIIYDNVIIEDDATIAAGSVVRSDVKKNNLVMGNPARVINKNFDFTTLLVNKDEGH